MPGSEVLCDDATSTVTDAAEIVDAEFCRLASGNGGSEQPGNSAKIEIATTVHFAQTGLNLSLVIAVVPVAHIAGPSDPNVEARINLHPMVMPESQLSHSAR